MSLDAVPIGGLWSRGVAAATPWGRAQVASDCILDGGALRGRAGYVNAITAGAAIATPTAAAAVQGMWRFRPHPSLAVTVACIDGKLYWGADPATESATVASWTQISGPGAKFGATATVSGAQMDQYLYLGSDVVDASWWRISWDGSLVTPVFTAVEIYSMPAPTVASFAESPSGAYTWTKFKDLTAYHSSAPDPVTTLQTLVGDWRRVEGSSVTTFDAGGWVRFTLPDTPTGYTGIDWRSMGWLVVGISPSPTASTAGSVEVSLATQVSGAPGDWQVLGTVYDANPTWGRGGSPNHVYLPLSGVPLSVLQNAKYLRFKVTEGTGKYNFAVYGYMALASPPTSRPMSYWATIQESGTLAESSISGEFKCNPVATPSFTSMQDIFLSGGSYGGGTDKLIPICPQALQQGCFNDEIGLARPRPAEIGTTITVTVNWAASSRVLLGKIVRLWKTTTTGKRLIGTATLVAGDFDSGSGITASAGHVHIADTVGNAALTGELYKAGGAPPACTAMAVKGRRIIAAGAATATAVKDQHANRLYISTYVPPNDTTDPFPAFPALPIDDADGWQMDFGSRADVVQSIVVGDAVYILTRENCYSMSILAQDQTPTLVLARGVRGRRAALYMEDALVWASSDGVYMAKGRSSWSELTGEVRSHYSATLQPSSATVVTYRNRQITIIDGARMMRYSTDEQIWTTGTYGHTIVCAACWNDQAGAGQQAWLLTSGGLVQRMQDGATTDGGVAIPSWVYTTGYSKAGEASRIRGVLADATGSLVVTPWVDGITSKASLVIPALSTEVYRPGIAGSRNWKWALSLTGNQSCAVRSLMWERE